MSQSQHSELSVFLRNVIPNNEIFSRSFIGRQLEPKIEQFKNTHKRILLLGTGGSSLGAQTLSALKKGQFSQKLFFADNIDPSFFYEQLSSLNLKETGILVISKSGETTETLAQLLTIIALFQKNSIPLIDRFLVVTEPRPSSLHCIAKDLQLTFFEHPSTVGGRFSIFSPVGHLTNYLSGVDNALFFQGGQDCIQHDIELVVRQTIEIYEACEKGINQLVTFVYSNRLKPYLLWFNQLWAESLGKKNPKNLPSMTPIGAVGTIDQHSQLQLYLDGTRDKFFRFIGFHHYLLNSKEPEPILSLSSLVHTDVPLSFQGKTLSDLFRAHFKLTIDVLEKKGLPLHVTIEDDLNEYTLGRIMMRNVLEVLTFAHLLNVDPFTQPQVEGAKKDIFSYF